MALFWQWEPFGTSYFAHCVRVSDETCFSFVFFFSFFPFDRSHNITRQLDKYFPNLVTPENLLMAARLSTIPFTLAATVVAAEVRETGYLLIVALYVHAFARTHHEDTIE
jgi:hypothetical protein